MMTERQRKFREQYRAAISRYYSGWVHIGVMYSAGIAAIWYCVSQLQGAGWEWLLLVPVLIGGNFAEWGMHKYVMHRLIDVFALRAIFDRHTRQHHQYFTDNDATIDTVREFRIVFFPWRVLIVPFIKDPNKARMNGLAGLVYTLAVSEEVPGQVTELTAKATRPDGVAALEETLVYEAKE